MSSEAAGWRVEAARNGRPALVRPDGTWAESRFEPDKDARRRVEDAGVAQGDHVLLLGLGGGELARMILAAVGGGGKLTVAEPVAEIVKLNAPLLGDDRVAVIANENAADFYAALLECIPDKTIVHPGLCYPPGFEGLKDCLDDFDIRRRSSLRFRKEADENFRINADHFAASPGISSLRGRLAGSDIIVAGGGPSLEKIARTIGSDANWIAVGTALRPLTLLSIRPHLVVITDPQASVAEQAAVPDPPPLVFFQTTAHQAVQCFSKRFAAAPEGPDALPAGGTVTTTAIGVAALLGARRIFFAGVDLAEPDGKTHSRGTSNEERTLSSTSRFRSVESREPKREERVEGVSNFDRIIPTRRNMLVYARAIEGLIMRYKDVEFIQLSDAALALKGARNGKPQDFQWKRQDLC